MVRKCLLQESRIRGRIVFGSSDRLCLSVMGDVARAPTAVERVTGIESGLSAWESVPSGLLYRLNCGAGCPRVTVRDRSSPGLMAR